MQSQQTPGKRSRVKLTRIQPPASLTAKAGASKLAAGLSRSLGVPSFPSRIVRQMMTTIPEDNRYAKSHEYVHVEGDTGTIGITDYAQKELGDVVFVELPQVGTQLEAGDELGSIESVKVNPSSSAATARSVVESVTGRTKEELISGNANVRSDVAAPYAERGRIYDADVTPGRRASSPRCHVATPEN